MVGQRTLDPFILVRIQVPQPICLLTPQNVKSIHLENMTCDHIQYVRQLAREKGLDPKQVVCTERKRFCQPGGCETLHDMVEQEFRRIEALAQAEPQLQVEPVAVLAKDPVETFYARLEQHAEIVRQSNGNGRIH